MICCEFIRLFTLEYGEGAVPLRFGMQPWREGIEQKFILLNLSHDLHELKEEVLTLLPSITGTDSVYSALYFARRLKTDEDDTREALDSLVDDRVLESRLSGHTWLYWVK